VVVTEENVLNEVTLVGEVVQSSVGLASQTGSGQQSARRAGEEIITQDGSSLNVGALE